MSSTNDQGPTVTISLDREWIEGVVRETTEPIRAEIERLAREREGAQIRGFTLGALEGVGAINRLRHERDELRRKLDDMRAERDEARARAIAECAVEREADIATARGVMAGYSGNTESSRVAIAACERVIEAMRQDQVRRAGACGREIPECGGSCSLPVGHAPPCSCSGNVPDDCQA